VTRPATHRAAGRLAASRWAGQGALGLAAVLAAIGGDPIRLLGRYDRTAIAAGEVWRLATGHLVHLGWAHTAMNLAGLAVLALLFADWLRTREWLLVSLVAAAAIDAGLYWGHPEIVWYVGLSGVLHGLWGAGAITGTLQRAPGAPYLLILLAGKLGWEAAAGALPFSAETAGGAVIVAAHLYGALGGAAWSTCRLAVQRLRRGSI
jgi:rhomboid family GlyGly-CTERM serine protease